jgi:hypothetical protein
LPQRSSAPRHHPGVGANARPQQRATAEHGPCPPPLGPWCHAERFAADPCDSRSALSLDDLDSLVEETVALGLVGATSDLGAVGRTEGRRYVVVVGCVCEGFHRPVFEAPVCKLWLASGVVVSASSAARIPRLASCRNLVASALRLTGFPNPSWPMVEASCGASVSPALSSACRTAHSASERRRGPGAASTAWTTSSESRGLAGSAHHERHRPNVEGVCRPGAHRARDDSDTRVTRWGTRRGVRGMRIRLVLQPRAGPVTLGEHGFGMLCSPRPVRSV